MPWRPRKLCIQKSDAEKHTYHFCQHETEKLNMFAEPELEKIQADNSDSLKLAEIELEH